MFILLFHIIKTSTVLSCSFEVQDVKAKVEKDGELQFVRNLEKAYFYPTYCGCSGGLKGPGDG